MLQKGRKSLSTTMDDLNEALKGGITAGTVTEVKLPFFTRIKQLNPISSLSVHQG